MPASMTFQISAEDGVGKQKEIRFENARFEQLISASAGNH